MATRKTRGEAAADSSLSKVKVFKLWHADETGAVAEHPHTLYLDKRDVPSFVFKVPEYMRRALQVEEQVNRATAEQARSRLQEIFRDFDEWIKTAKAEPIIGLTITYEAYDVDGERISNDSTHRFGYEKQDRDVRVQLAYFLAFRVNGQLHHREPLQLRRPLRSITATEESRAKEEAEVEEHNARERALDLGGGFKVGGRFGRYSDTMILGYTPELHAKLDQVIEALSGAARVLRTIEQADNKAALLLSLGAGIGLLAAPSGRTEQ